MIKITITPPNQSSYEKDFTTVSDAIDYLLTLHTYGYEGSRKAAQQSVHRTADNVAAKCDCVEFMRSGKHDYRCATRRR